MSIFGILISVGVSFVFTLALRYVDRDNRSLDKVKKYIGIQKEDLDEKFNGHIARLKNEYNEVEVKQTQAIATVRNLEDKIGEFDQLTHEFDTRIQAVDAIDSKISAYDETLRQLVEMTANLEENMRRVGAESSVVDKLEKQMVVYQKNVSAIEGRISRLTADFAEENGKQLKQMGLHLPDDMAIIGCDNQFFCPYTDPPLTSVDLHPEEMTQSAVRELLIARKNTANPFSMMREATLIVRESCGAKLGYRKLTR